MRRTVAGIGRTLITLGLLILLFVGYQLWGTDVFAARAQDKLENELDALISGLGDDPTVATTTTAPRTPTTTGDRPTTTTTAPPAARQLPAIAEGDPLGRITIPSAGVNWVFVQGTNRDDLTKGPGHYPTTPLPGQVGNAAIAGHRTTYGAPFYNIDKVRARFQGQPGDYIVTESLIGTHVFEIIDLRIVTPEDTWVAGPVTLPENKTERPDLKLDPKKSYLTLTSCHPRFSARERIVVLAQLIENNKDHKDAPESEDAVGDVKIAGQGKTPDAAQLEEGLEGDISSRGPALLTGTIVALVGLLWWWAFRRYRHPITWFTGVIPFLALLFVFYVFLERLLPAGY